MKTTRYVLANPNGTCSEGIYAVKTCTNCGDEHVDYDYSYNYHASYLAYGDYEKYGMEVYTCACKRESRVSIYNYNKITVTEKAIDDYTLESTYVSGDLKVVKTSVRDNHYNYSYTYRIYVSDQLVDILFDNKF